MNSQYAIQGCIGSGSSCTVYEAIKDGKQYAIKVLVPSKLTNEQIQFMKTEIEILQILKNPHIIEFIEVIQDQSTIQIVTEFCQFGSLEVQLNKQSLFKREEQVTNFLLQMCSALLELKRKSKQLLQQEIIHNDIKPANILLGNNCFKLADFGFAMREGHTVKHNFGSTIYMSPETLQTNIHSYQSDMWSLGITLYQLIYGFTPFSPQNDKELINCYRTQSIQYNYQTTPLKFINIMTKMLEKDPRRRITVENLYKVLSEKENNNFPSKDKTSRRQSIQKLTNSLEKLDYPPLQISNCQIQEENVNTLEQINYSKKNSFPTRYQPPQDDGQKHKPYYTTNKQPFLKISEEACNLCQFVKKLRVEITDNELLIYVLNGILLYYTKQDKQSENRQITVFVEQQEQPNIFQMQKADLLQFCLTQLKRTIKFQLNQFGDINEKFYPESKNQIKLLINLYNLFIVLKSGDITSPLIPVNKNISYREAMQELRQIYI